MKYDYIINDITEYFTQNKVSVGMVAHKFNLSNSTTRRILKNNGVNTDTRSCNVTNKQKEQLHESTLLKITDIIHKNYPTNMDSCRLKKYLLKYNIIENKCNICGIDSYWNNMSLVLQLDHVDGNPKNNILQNLRLLCPNCHSQTPTFSGKHIHKKSTIDYTILEKIIKVNKPNTIGELLRLANVSQTNSHYKMVRDYIQTHNIKTNIKHKCTHCHTLITSNTKHGLCKKCSHTKTYRCKHPTKEELIELLKTSNPHKLGIQFGVSSNSIRKWIKSYEINKSDYAS